jgi:hypothetical protein
MVLSSVLRLHDCAQSDQRYPKVSGQIRGSVDRV